MRSFGAISMLFICVSFANAQSDLRPGYLLTSTGDTVRGYFTHKDLEKIYKVATIRDQSSNSTTYKPQEVRAYGTDSVRFETHAANAGEETFKAFYQVLFLGDVSLYINEDEELFIGADSLDRIFPLKNRNMLVYLMSSRPEMKEKASAVKIRISPLIELLTEFHEKEGVTDYKAFPRPQPLSLSFFYGYGGYAVGTMKAVDETKNMPADGGGPVVGAGFDLSPSRNFAYLIDVALFKEKFEVVESYDYTAIDRSDYYSFEATSLSVSLGAKLNLFRMPKSVLYLAAGAMWTSNFSSDASFKRVTLLHSTGNTEVVEEELEYYAKGYGGFWGALGVNKKVGKRLFFAEVKADQRSNPSFSLFKVTGKLGMSLYKF